MNQRYFRLLLAAVAAASAILGLAFIVGSATAAPHNEDKSEFYRGVYAACLWQLAGDEPPTPNMIASCQQRIELYQISGWERLPLPGWDELAPIELTPSPEQTPTRLSEAQTAIALTAMPTATPKAFVVSRVAAPLRSAPDNKPASQVGTVWSGQKLSVLECTVDWCKVAVFIWRGNTK